ncbi:host cell division inhibitor Icd-like protein [Shigella sonnei]|nr:icd-like protein [Escherichia coli]EFY5862965.1 host cell division inhibitor Icd-like protein [Shigella sonnei]
MKIEYTPERGRGFVRPGETGKPQNWGFSGIKKAAPKWSRLSEQITRCAVCVCDPKHKHGDDSRYQAGGQCNQSGSVRCHTCNERFSLYSLRNCSRAKAHGANLSDSCSIFLRRLFRAGDNVLVNSLSVIVLSCIAMRRNTSHHGADSDYSDSLALRRCSSSRAMAISCPSSSVALIPIFSTCANASREEIRGFSLLPSAWRRAISPRMAVTMNPALLSPSSFTDSMPSKASCGIRIEICFDLSLIVFFAMCILLNKRCDSVYTKKNHKKHLTCDSVEFNLNHTSVRGCKRQRPELFAAVAGRLTKPLTGVTIMAGTQHTPRLAHTQTAFVWRFLALSAGESQIIHVTAWTEREARSRCPSGCVAVFAARIRQEVCHVQ